MYEIVSGGFGHGSARDFVLKNRNIREWLIKDFGVKYISMLNCDNAFMPEEACFGWHILSGENIKPGEEHMSIVAVEKTDPTEGVGMAVIVGENKNHGMIEYNQVPPEFAYHTYTYEMAGTLFVIYRDDYENIRLRPVGNGTEDDISRFFTEHYKEEKVDGNIFF